MLSLKYPHFKLGFSWIIRLRCGYKYNTTIAIRMGRVSEDFPMKWTVFPGPWRVDGKGITYIRCTNYSFL